MLKKISLLAAPDGKAYPSPIDKWVRTPLPPIAPLPPPEPSSDLRADVAESWLERIRDEYEDDCGCDDHDSEDCCVQQRHARCAKCMAESALAALRASTAPDTEKGHA